jgi:hypothetical protein
VRHRWLSLCTVWPSHSQIFSLSIAIIALGKNQKSQGAKYGLYGPDRPRLYDAWLNKSLHKSCRMGRPSVLMKLICSLGHCECDGHTVHKLIQRRLTADWLAPLESECSRMQNKVSSEWLPCYIKANRPVLEILKMAAYFPDSSRNLYLVLRYFWKRIAFWKVSSFCFFYPSKMSYMNFEEDYGISV